MLKQIQTEIRVGTSGRGFIEITSKVREFVRRSKIGSGLAVLHIRHTSASLVIQENADPDVRTDLETFFSDLVPDGSPAFEHILEGPDDMPAHVRSALTNVNLSVPVADGKPVLGIWQGIYIWEHRRHPHTREVILHVIGE